MDDFNIESEIIKLIREIEEIQKSLMEAKAEVNAYESPMLRQQFIYKVNSLEISLVLKQKLLNLLVDKGDAKMDKDITREENDVNKLFNEVEENFDRLDDYINKIRKKSRKQWISGFVSGYGAAVAGIAVGATFIKFINKRTK